MQKWRVKKKPIIIMVFALLTILTFSVTKGGQVTTIVSNIKQFLGGGEVHTNFKIVELREGSEDGPVIANLLENSNPEIIPGKDYYLTVTMNTPTGSDGFFKVSLSDEKAHGFYFVNIPGQKYEPAEVDSDAFDRLLSFTDVEDMTYGSNNTVYSLKDGALEYHIKDTKMNGRELYASFGFRLDPIAWNPNETNIEDVLKIFVGAGETKTDELSVSTQVNETKSIYLSGSTNTYNTTRTIPQVGLGFSLTSTKSSPIIYEEIGYKVTYPDCAEFMGASFSSTDINSLNSATYGVVKVSDPVDNNDGTLSRTITIGPGKKEQTNISGFIYNHVVFNENARVNSTYPITYSDMYYIPRGDTEKVESAIGPNINSTSLTYNYKVFSEENYIDRTTIDPVNRTGDIAVFNWNVGKDKGDIVKSIQLLGGANLKNGDTIITKYKKTVKASFNTTNENANIALVTIPVGLETETVYKNKLSVNYAAIDANGNEFSGVAVLDRILGGTNKYVILRAVDVGAVSIKSIEANIGYLPVNYYSCSWTASNSISSNMFAAYGYFTDGTVGNRVKNTFEVLDEAGQGVSNDLKTTSLADSTGNSKIVYNNSVQNGETKNSLSVVAGNSLELKNKKIIPYYVMSSTYANTSIVTNPVIYLLMPKGMSFNNLKIRKEVTNNYFSGRNAKTELDYTIDNITYLNNLDDDVNIYKVTFNDRNLVIGVDCNEYGDSIDLLFDVVINTTKTMITKVYDFDTLINVTSETPVAAKTYPNGASLPVEDKYNINGGLPLGGSRVYNTTLNGISVQRLDAITVDNAISISKIDGEAVDEATRTWDTYDESNQNSISYMGYNTEGEYRIKIQNPSSSDVSNFAMILPIPKANYNPGSAFSPEAYGFNLDLSPKSLDGFTSKYIKINGEIAEKDRFNAIEYEEVSKEEANAILISKSKIAAYDNSTLMYNFKVTKDDSVVKGAFNRWKNFFSYKLDNSIIEGSGSYVATEIAASEITGTVFIDNNNNGKLDSDESIKTGVNVVATDSLGRVQFAETDDKGQYNFTNVREDDVSISMSINTSEPYWFVGEVLPNDNGIYNNAQVQTNKKEAKASVYTNKKATEINASINRIHVISYDVNKGSGNAPTSQEVIKNSQIKVATPPSGMILNGAEFIGWSFNPVALADDNTDKVDVRAGDILTVTEDATLYAVYQNKYIKLTFDYQGAENHPDYDFKYVKAGQKLNVADKDGRTFPSPTKNGYTYWKWEVASGELGRGNAIDGGTTCSFEEDTIIRVVFLKLNKASDSVNLTVGDSSNEFYVLSDNLITENLPGFYNYGYEYTLDSESVLPEGLVYDDGVIKGKVSSIFDQSIKFNVKQLLNNTGSSYKNFNFTLTLKSTPKKINMELSANVDGGVVVGEEDKEIEISANVSGLVSGLDINEGNKVSFAATKSDGITTNIGKAEISNGVATIKWNLTKEDIGLYSITASIDSINEEYEVLNNTGISSFVVSEQELEKHTITFDTDGYDIAIAPKVYVHDTELGALPNIKISGYKIDGWYDENGTKVDSATKVTSDMTLKVRYNAIEYNVKYTSKNVLINIPDKTINYNSSNLLPTDNFMVDGYTLISWQLENGTVITNDTKYQDIVANDEVESITLYGVYSPNEYIVKYDSKGGSLSVNEFKVKYNNIYGELVTPTLIGSTFKGWFDQNGNEVKGSDKYEFTQNTVLTAHWEYKTGFMVKYDSVGGTPVESSEVSWIDKVIPGIIPVKNGYTFSGWLYDNAQVTENDTYGSVAQTDKLESITLYASYIPNEYNVTFDGKGAIVEDTKIVKYDERYGEMPVPTKAGFTFKGWYDEDGDNVNSNSRYTYTKDTVLTAKWEYKAGYKIIINDENGKLITEDEVNWDTSFNDLNINLHKDGYRFKGFAYGDQTLSSASTYGNIVSDDTVESITVSPVYEYRNDYEVAFITSSDDVINSIFVHYDSLLEIENIKPTRKGHIFKGWSFANEIVEDKKYYELAGKDTVNKITLVAEWEIDYTYNFIKGDVQRFTQNQINKYEIKIDGNYALFDKVIINSINLEKDIDYVVTEGSTVVTFTEQGIAKLNTLQVGEYEVEVLYINDKSAIGKIIIEKADNPITMDNMKMNVIIFMISAIGLLFSKKSIEQKNRLSK